MIYRFEAALLFYNSDCFKSRIRAHVKDASVTPRRFLLDAESMPMLDSTGAASLAEIVDELSRQGISFAVARPNERFRLLFERTALKEKIGDGNIFSTIESAVTALQNGGRERGAA
jgi:MFS superfamily sulfate permease-like transporter